MAKNGTKNGQKWEIVGVAQSDTAAIVFRVHPILAKKHRELPFLAIALFYSQPMIPPNKRFDIFPP